jgi:hypothetical protein
VRSFGSSDTAERRVDWGNLACASLFQSFASALINSTSPSHRSIICFAKSTLTPFSGFFGSRRDTVYQCTASAVTSLM